MTRRAIRLRIHDPLRLAAATPRDNFGVRQRSEASIFHERLRLLKRIAAAVPFVVIFAVACESRESKTPPQQRGSAPTRIERRGPFAVAGGVLYRAVDDSLKPVLALPGAGPAPDTAAECAPAIPKLGQQGFGTLILAPDSDAVAWVTGGPGACVGVDGLLPQRGGVLGRWTEAIPEEIVWAPAGRYLAVWLEHAHGRHSIDVFDTWTGERLEMPWREDCEGAEACDVKRVEWAGGTLLDVEIRLGPGEVPVPFEVNVGGPASD